MVNNLPVQKNLPALRLVDFLIGSFLAYNRCILAEKYHNKLKVLIHIILLCVYFYCKFKNTDLLM